MLFTIQLNTARVRVVAGAGGETFYLYASDVAKLLTIPSSAFADNERLRDVIPGSKSRRILVKTSDELENLKRFKKSEEFEILLNVVCGSTKLKYDPKTHSVTTGDEFDWDNLRFTMIELYGNVHPSEIGDPNTTEFARAMHEKMVEYGLIAPPHHVEWRESNETTQRGIPKYVIRITSESEDRYELVKERKRKSRKVEPERGDIPATEAMTEAMSEETPNDDD